MKRKHLAFSPHDFKVIEDFSERSGLPKTKAVIHAIISYKKFERWRDNFLSSDFDKAVWYATKLCFSVQSLKEKVVAGDGEAVTLQLQRIDEITKTIYERLKIDVRDVAFVAAQYARTRERDDMVTLNEATKEAVKEIVRSILTR